MLGHPRKATSAMRFSNLPLRAKLGLALGFLSLMVLAVTVIALISLGNADSNFGGFVSGISTRTAVATRLRNAVDARAISARNLVLVSHPADKEIELATVKKSHAEVLEKLAELQTLAKAPGVSKTARELIANIAMVEQAYGPVALAIVDFVIKGDKDAAIADMNDNCRPLLAQLVKAADDYAAFAATVAVGQSIASGEQYVQQRNILVSASIVSVMAAFLAA